MVGGLGRYEGILFEHKIMLTIWWLIIVEGQTYSLAILWKKNQQNPDGSMESMSSPWEPVGDSKIQYSQMDMKNWQVETFLCIVMQLVLLKSIGYLHKIYPMIMYSSAGICYMQQFLIKVLTKHRLTRLHLVVNSDTTTWYLWPKFNHPCQEVLSPVFAQLHVGSVITILLDSAMDI